MRQLSHDLRAPFEFFGKFLDLCIGIVSMKNNVPNNQTIIARMHQKIFDVQDAGI